ncbi:MAG: hypothetical protein ACRELA_08050 [Candidatus Rokuibacteriota bacterium]
MDLRYFELHDLLCDAMICLEAGNHEAAASTVRKALFWVEADWLATPSDLATLRGPVVIAGTPDDDDELPE